MTSVALPLRRGVGCPGESIERWLCGDVVDSPPAGPAEMTTVTPLLETLRRAQMRREHSAPGPLAARQWRESISARLRWATVPAALTAEPPAQQQRLRWPDSSPQIRLAGCHLVSQPRLAHTPVRRGRLQIPTQTRGTGCRLDPILRLRVRARSKPVAVLALGSCQRRSRR